jgi:hypothetical protein
MEWRSVGIDVYVGSKSSKGDVERISGSGSDVSSRDGQVSGIFSVSATSSAGGVLGGTGREEYVATLKHCLGVDQANRRRDCRSIIVVLVLEGDEICRIDKGDGFTNAD